MRPATRQDVRHICETMWERGRIELSYWPTPSGLGVSPADWLHSWKTRIARDDAVAFGPEGKPHAILGWDWESENVCNTSFQASRSFEEGSGRAVTKEIRRAIPGLMQKCGAEMFNTYSLCIVPEAEKWFRLLGLTEDTKYTGPQCGPFRLRRFVYMV